MASPFRTRAEMIAEANAERDRYRDEARTRARAALKFLRERDEAMAERDRHTEALRELLHASHYGDRDQLHVARIEAHAVLKGDLIRETLDA